MTSAEKAEGPWEPLTTLLAESGWDDCTAIWDEQGKAWFAGTCFRDGYKTYLFPMADDARSIDRSRARLINEGYGREANKLIRHDGYYYLIFSEHRDGIGRYVLAKRDRKMTGRSDLRREWRINNFYVLKFGCLEYFPYICNINIPITNEAERFFCF